MRFWFDPICPFCWMTSRWITSVAEARDLTIDWQPISLLMKNEMGPDHPFAEKATRTRDLLRVVEAVRAAGGADRIGDLYTAFGRRIHHEETLDFDVAAILVELGLDPALADALHDVNLDAAIRSRMDVGLALAGTDVGTPIVGVDGPDGPVALFGPVITRFPEGDAGLHLWDGVVALATIPGFFELKRTRTEQPDPSTIPG